MPWYEAMESIERGWSFNAGGIGVSAEALAPLGDMTRYLEPVDVLARHVLDSQAEQYWRYLGAGIAEASHDVGYVLMRDGRALAAVLRDGQVTLNRELPSSGRVCFTLARLLPSLRLLGQRYSQHAAVGWN